MWNSDLPVTNSTQEETASKEPAWNVQETPTLCSEWTRSLLPQGLRAFMKSMNRNNENLCSKMFFLFSYFLLFFPKYRLVSQRLIWLFRRRMKRDAGKVCGQLANHWGRYHIGQIILSEKKPLVPLLGSGHRTRLTTHQNEEVWFLK